MYKSEKYKAHKLDEVRDDGAEWIRKTLGLVKAEHVNACGAQGFIARREITREVMAQKLSAALQIMYRQSLYIDQMETYNQKLHSDVIDSQRTVVDLQKDLLATKDKQLDDLKSVVVASVEDTVKSELKTYSAAVKESTTSAAGPLLNSDRNILKNVIKDVVAEGDRSRNLMLFGLKEEKGELLCEKVGQVLLELGEKPKIEASRIGLNKPKDKKQVADRPVKVTLTSSTIVQQILTRARHRRSSELFSKVFISPDRSPEERAEQQKLVLELKKRSNDEPDKRHFIKGGKVCSMDKIVG